MNIMNPWADPTVGNSRCSLSLESLVLRHNEITSGPAGEVPSSGELLSALGSLDFEEFFLNVFAVVVVAAAAVVAAVLLLFNEII